MTKHDPSIVPTGVPTGHIDFNPANLFTAQQHAASGEDGPALSLNVPTPREAAPVALPRTQPIAPSKPLRRRTIVQQAKARIRELRAELKSKARLERELAELERLVTAAARPVASVRTIDSTRRHG